MTFVWILLLGFVGLLGGWILYAKFFENDSFIWVILENKKRFFISVLVMVILAIIIFIKPLYYMSSCSFRGMITNTETQYSWFMGECQGKTVNGSYINIDKNRGLPDGKDSDNSSHDDYNVE